ncbi:MAG: hypothetical protein HUK02_03230 [Bacteroidaceae bacterium]|nr:hypothetical protein [Bacteroidaceae bacterium]
MKHTSQDEQLYEQFMQELDAGAQEYDRLIASGKSPAALVQAKRQKRYWYAVAASFVGILVVAGTIFLNQSQEEQGQTASANWSDEKMNPIKEELPTMQRATVYAHLDTKTENRESISPVPAEQTPSDNYVHHLPEFCLLPAVSVETTASQLVAQDETPAAVKDSLPYEMLPTMILAEVCSGCGEFVANDSNQTSPLTFMALVYND